MLSIQPLKSSSFENLIDALNFMTKDSFEPFSFQVVILPVIVLDGFPWLVLCKSDKLNGVYVRLEHLSLACLIHTALLCYFWNVRTYSFVYLFNSVIYVGKQERKLAAPLTCKQSSVPPLAIAAAVLCGVAGSRRRDLVPSESRSDMKLCSSSSKSSSSTSTSSVLSMLQVVGRLDDAQRSTHSRLFHWKWHKILLARIVCYLHYTLSCPTI